MYIPNLKRSILSLLAIALFITATMHSAEARFDRERIANSTWMQIPNYLMKPDLAVADLQVHKDAQWNEDHKVIVCLVIENIGFAGIGQYDTFILARGYNYLPEVQAYVDLLRGPLYPVQFAQNNKIYYQFKHEFPLDNEGEMSGQAAGEMTIILDGENSAGNDSIDELREYNNRSTVIHDPKQAETIFSCEQIWDN